MDDDEAFNEYSRTLLSSRNIMYSILSLLEQQEQTLQRLAVTAALRRASRATREDETVSDTELSEPPRQRRRTIYRRSALQSPVRSNVRFRNPPVDNETTENNSHQQDDAEPDNPNSTTSTNSNINNEEGIPLPRPTRQPPRPTAARTNPISDLFTQAILNTLGQLSPVRVTPSASQIERATERMTFGDLPSDISRYQSCPICHDTFTPETEILRIRHCGHYFSRNAILTWFDMNCHCPICRHDIREGLSPTSSEDNGETHHEEIIEENSPTNNQSDLGLSTFVDAITQDIQRRGPRSQSIPIQYSFEFIPASSSTEPRPRAGRPTRSAYPSTYATSRSNTTYLPDHLSSSFNIPNTTGQTTTNYTSTYTRDYIDPSGNIPPYDNNTNSTDSQ